MRRTWIFWLLLAGCAWCDEREVVTRVFRRPEFLWKWEEKQLPPPVYQVPRPSGGFNFGRPDRTAGLPGSSTDPNGLMVEDPEASATSETPPASGTPRPGASKLPSSEETPKESTKPSQPGTPGASATPTSDGQTGASETPSGEGTPLENDSPSQQSTSGASGDKPGAAETPSVESRPGATEAPSEEGTPPQGGTPSAQATPSDSAKPAEDSPLSASKPGAEPELPDHPPPPLDYPVKPGLLEKIARWWNALLGRRQSDGLQGALVLLRDLGVLLLMAVFVRQLIPLLRQLRAWFKTETPPKLALEENGPEPEILPEWQQLWRQAGELDKHGRSVQAQRIGYLAVLSFLDHGGHIRYRPCGTNREYLAHLEAPLREPFARITRSFERCRYGGQPPDFAQFQAVCRELLPQ